MLLRLFPVAGGRRILEVGCGRGVALPRIASLCQPARLVGVDIDEELLGHAHQRVALAGIGAELYSADVRELPFADGDFDASLEGTGPREIVGLGASSPYSPDAALREISRVLCDGGQFIHEAPIAQLIAHPVRSQKGRLPWHASAKLTGERRALLWASRRKVVRH